jgi:hypothetical protein
VPHDLNALRARLEYANRRAAESERLITGWREIMETEQAAGHDVSVARDLLKTFESGLELAMSDKEQAARALGQRLLELFEGVRGRLPKNDQELQEWLASPEGKAATAFEPTSVSRWDEIGPVIDGRSSCPSKLPITGWLTGCHGLGGHGRLAQMVPSRQLAGAVAERSNQPTAQVMSAVENEADD